MPFKYKVIAAKPQRNRRNRTTIVAENSSKFAAIAAAKRAETDHSFETNKVFSIIAETMIDTYPVEPKLNVVPIVAGEIAHLVFRDPAPIVIDEPAEFVDGYFLDVLFAPIPAADINCVDSVTIDEPVEFEEGYFLDILFSQPTTNDSPVEIVIDEPAEFEEGYFLDELFSVCETVCAQTIFEDTVTEENITETLKEDSITEDSITEVTTTQETSEDTLDKTPEFSVPTFGEFISEVISTEETITSEPAEFVEGYFLDLLFADQTTVVEPVCIPEPVTAESVCISVSTIAEPVTATITVATATSTSDESSEDSADESDESDHSDDSENSDESDTSEESDESSFYEGSDSEDGFYFGNLTAEQQTVPVAHITIHDPVQFEDGYYLTGLFVEHETPQQLPTVSAPIDIREAEEETSVDVPEDTPVDVPEDILVEAPEDNSVRAPKTSVDAPEVSVDAREVNSSSADITRVNTANRNTRGKAPTVCATLSEPDDYSDSHLAALFNELPPAQLELMFPDYPVSPCPTLPISPTTVLTGSPSIFSAADVLSTSTTLVGSVDFRPKAIRVTLPGTKDTKDLKNKDLKTKDLKAKDTKTKTFSFKRISASLHKAKGIVKSLIRTQAGLA